MNERTIDQERSDREESISVDHSGQWSVQDTVTAIRATVATFELEVGPINALNVFPVPDGDTGTNMYLTLTAICDELDARDQELPDRVDGLFKIVTRGALMGARGNSGVILYQIIAGLGTGLEGHDSVTGTAFARGLDWASEMAYRAVNNPVEGTMLSVIRAAAEASHHYIEQDAPLLDVLTTAREAAEVALEKTPDQLPILKQAGVVDAGGQGLVVLLSGLEQFARGELDSIDFAAISRRSPTSATEMHFLDQADVVHGLDEYGYCINFSITGDDLDNSGLREAIDAIGTSTVIVGDDSMMKVHTHSEHPGTMLEAALVFGELHDIRIDNMTSQTQRLLAERQAYSYLDDPDVQAAAAMSTTIGVVAIGSGEGIIHALKGMGARAVVSGGASMNPSTSEIREAIEEIDTTEVIVLPNDSNILASARHAAELVDKAVQVVPTTSIQEGIAALAAFNFNASLAENATNMTAATTHVRSLAIARATRDARIEDLEFRTGEFLGMLDGKPRVTGPDACKVLIELLAAAEAEEYELATIFVGENVDGKLEEEVVTAVAREYPDLEVEVTVGGQPHFELLISLE